jgi:hypothetical protein
MARFSKAALLKWLEAQQRQAEQLRDACVSPRSKERQRFWDGEAVAYLATRGAIERGEIGEGK